MTNDWRDDRIGSALRGENPTVLGETKAGFAVIGDTQFLPGYSVLLSRTPGPTALAELPRPERVQFLADTDLLATAVERACRRVGEGFTRINIDILGNKDAFVHAHVWPRFDWEDEVRRRYPVWLYDGANWSDPAHALGPQHDELRQAIADELAAAQAEFAD